MFRSLKTVLGSYRIKLTSYNLRKHSVRPHLLTAKCEIFRKQSCLVPLLPEKEAITRRNSKHYSGLFPSNENHDSQSL